MQIGGIIRTIPKKHEYLVLLRSIFSVGIGVGLVGFGARIIHVQSKNSCCTFLGSIPNLLFVTIPISCLKGMLLFFLEGDCAENDSPYHNTTYVGFCSNVIGLLMLKPFCSIKYLLQVTKSL